jgi:hypothetical protein
VSDYGAEKQPPLSKGAAEHHLLRKAPLAIEAVRRMDAIFAIEHEINGATAEQRLAFRNEPAQKARIDEQSSA